MILLNSHYISCNICKYKKYISKIKQTTENVTNKMAYIFVNCWLKDKHYTLTYTSKETCVFKKESTNFL